jgi:hypothetical protein
MKVRVNEKDVTEVAQRIALNLNDREGEKPWNESNLYFQRRSHWAGKRALHWSDQKARHGF